MTIMEQDRLDATIEHVRQRPVDSRTVTDEALLRLVEQRDEAMLVVEAYFNGKRDLTESERQLCGDVRGALGDNSDPELREAPIRSLALLEELSAIERLYMAASPGPWDSSERSADGVDRLVDADGNDLLIVDADDLYDVNGNQVSPRACINKRVDAQLVVAMHEAFPHFLVLSRAALTRRRA